MTKSENIDQLATALSKAQAEIEGAAKDSENPFFKSSYADLSSVWSACRGPLTKNGLAVTQALETTERGVAVVTTLLHSSGQWVQGMLTMPVAKLDPQSVGSAASYGRRYALAAMVGVVSVEEDDDAEGAMRRPKPGPGPGPSSQAPLTTRGAGATAGPKPRARTASKAADAPVRSREELNKALMDLYRPYMAKYPETIFQSLLSERYGVAETKLMTTEQLEDLIGFLRDRLGQDAAPALQPGDFGYEGQEPGGGGRP